MHLWVTKFSTLRQLFLGFDCFQNLKLLREIVPEPDRVEVLGWRVPDPNKGDLTFLPYVETFDQMLGFSEPSLPAICDLPMDW